MLRYYFGVVLLFIASCGNQSVNKIFVTNRDLKRMDVLLTKAQAYYDQQKFSSAVASAEKAYAINPNHERAAQLLAYSKLGASGVDIFSLVEVLAQIATAPSLSALLVQVENLLHINTQSLVDMSTSFDEGSAPYFTGLGLYLPATPGNYLDPTSPRGKIPVLYSVNEVISILCPFVPASLKRTGTRYQCKAATGHSAHPDQTYMLYALGHLVEAVVFNAELFYPTNVVSTTNGNDPIANSHLMARIKALGAVRTSSLTTLSEFTVFVNALTALETTFNAVLNPNTGSMEAELVQDFTVMADSLAAIAGLPTSVTTSINSALSSLKTAQASDNLASLQATYKQQAFNKFGDSFVASASAAIDKAKAVGGTDEQVAAVCTALKALLGKTSSSLPTQCVSS
jgi:hypothetical protein